MKHIKPTFIASIRDLSDLSGSPQFAAVAAVLPSESIEKQQQVSQVMKSLINATSSALLSAKTLAANPGDVHEGNLFMQLASNLNSACSNLIRGLSDNAPGRLFFSQFPLVLSCALRVGLKECAAAVAVLQESEIDLDGALVIVEASNILPTRGDNTVEGFQENMLSSAQEIEAAAEEIRLSSLSQQQNLGKAVISRRPVHFCSAAVVVVTGFLMKTLPTIFCRSLLRVSALLLKLATGRRRKR
jgi:hypothetical protein